MKWPTLVMICRLGLCLTVRKYVRALYIYNGATGVVFGGYIADIDKWRNPMVTIQRVGRGIDDFHDKLNVTSCAFCTGIYIVVSLALQAHFRFGFWKHLTTIERTTRRNFCMQTSYKHICLLVCVCWHLQHGVPHVGLCSADLVILKSKCYKFTSNETMDV